MDVVDNYLSLLTKLVEEEEVFAAAQRVKEAAIMMVETLSSLDTPKAPKRTFLGADVPRELKMLLHYFNKEDDKISYSKELFNDVTPVDPAGKMFLKLVNDMKEETLEYLKENIDKQHQYTFEQIKTHIKYFYVNYLLCYFLLKNENVSTGINITDADIDIFLTADQIEDPEIQDTVEKVTRFVVGESKEPYVHPKGLSINMERRILEGTMRQVSAIVKQKQDIVTQSTSESKDEIIAAALSETDLAYKELDETRLELAKSASLRDNLEKLIMQQSEIDSVTRQKILEDSDKFTEILRIILSIAKELDNDVDYIDILKRLDEIPIVPDIEDTGDELIQTRNSLLEKQQIQLLMICEHIKEIVVTYSRFQSMIANHVTSNTLLEEELRQVNILIDNSNGNQIQTTQIVEMQREIRMLEQTITEIQQMMDAANAQHEASLGIQVEANRELNDEYSRIRDREQNMQEQLQRLRDKSDENDSIALLERRLERANEIIAQFKVEPNLEEKVQDSERFDYEETIQNLNDLLRQTESSLAEKQRTIYILTSEIQEANDSFEQSKIESREATREAIERIMNESVVEIQNMTDRNEEKINAIIDDAQTRIHAAREQVNAIEEISEYKIAELQRQLDISIREKAELEQNKGESNIALESKISDLERQLAEAKVTKKSDLEKQLAEPKEGAENVDKIKRMQYMNLLYLIQIRKLNQIILDNRAKLSFQSAKEESQLTDEELLQLLSEIQHAEDNKLLLEENPLNHIADSIYGRSANIIQTQGNAQHNVGVFIETFNQATSKITELQEELGTNSKDLDGVKSAFAKLQSAYEEKNTKLASTQKELVESSKNMHVYKLTANGTIRALREELGKKENEIKDAVHQEISKLTAKVAGAKEEAAAAKEETAAAKEEATAAKELQQSTAQELSDEKAKSTDLERKIEEIKERAKKDVAKLKEKYDGQIVALSEIDTLRRRLNQKEENVVKLTKALEKTKDATGKAKNATKIAADAYNKLALQDTIIVELRKEMDALKEKMKSKETFTEISELTDNVVALYRKRIEDGDQARRELLASQHVVEGAARIDDLTRQLGENKSPRIEELEKIKNKLIALLDKGITREQLNAIFNAA